MKKLTAILLSVMLIFPAGTVSAMADPAVDPLTAPAQDETDPDGSPEEEAVTEEGAQAEAVPEETTGDLGSGADADTGSSTEERTGDAQDADAEEPSAEEEKEGEQAEDAEENTTEEKTEVATLAVQTLSVNDYVKETDLGELSLVYDDRYDLSTYTGISSGTDYTICISKDADIQSYQVAKGAKSKDKDESLITLTEEGGTTVAATGVGSGDVFIIKTDDLEKLKDLSQEDADTDDPNEEVPAAADLREEHPDTEDQIAEISDEEIPDEEKVDVYKLFVTVDKAPLTLMYLTGQSNMEGYTSDSTGYELNASVACTDGSVYSTYMPSTASRGKSITGISISAGSASTAGNYVAGSLQGAVQNADDEETSEDSSYTIVGTLEAPVNSSGGKLTYPLNSLTSEGSGKAGPDSGLAYEWNRQTGDKVWVINTAYGSTDISDWTAGGKCYELSSAVWKYVQNTYNAEMGNHYTDGSVSGNKLIFWLQGETNDAKNLSSAADYESYFNNMYSSMGNALGNTSIPFGIIMVRAGYAKKSYTTEKDLYMSPPRIAQYFLGSKNSSYGNVFVVSNANEQWVTDSGVSSYFKNAYSGGFSYPMQGASKSLPTTVSAVHSDIHYSQVGHNENGITAADGMCVALGIKSDSSSPKVTWKDVNASSVTSVTMDALDEYTTVVPVVDPVYLSKKVSYSISDKKVISYDYATGFLQGTAYGTSTITPSGGSGTLSVTVSGTDIVKINGVWTYTVDGKADYTYTGLAKNSNGWYYIKNGVLDRTYTGFAKNENGSWYVTEGKLTRKDNSVIKDEKGALGSKSEWYYVVASKVQSDYTGLANYKNDSGWWYIKKGRVDRSYTGFAKNNNGSWYVTNGKLTRKDNSVIKDKTGALGPKSEWYYVVSSKVQSSFTGLADYKNASGWWYITKGKVDRTANTVAKNKNGWYYVKNGKVNRSYTGFATNSNGDWYVVSGRVTKKVNGVYKDNKGAIGSKNSWYYVVGNRVRYDFTGLANYKNASGWWYIENGKVDRTFARIAKNKNGTYYLKNGKVQKSFSGSVKISGKTYQIKNGKVV